MPFTLNGRSWQLSDFLPWGFSRNWEPFFGDLTAELTGFQGGLLRDQAAASAASAATSAQLAQTAAGAAGTGTATGLVYAAAVKNLLTAADIVAVHMYDTAQDNDGGAWTERCRATSWYHEALNTATRGATRRFPRLALIVARPVNLSIYDLHDLDGSGVPRLWMAFTTQDAIMAMLTASPITTISARNGRVYVGTATTGLHILDFPGDCCDRLSGGFRLRRRATIAQRNSVSGETIIIGAAPLIAATINHVHARTLPGGPVDAAGLAIPTVAVATASGTTVLYPWGAAHDITDASGHTRAHLTRSGRLFLVRGGNTSQVEVGPLPYADVAASSWRAGFYAGPASAGLLRASTDGAVTGLTGRAQGSANGLRFLAEDAGNPAAGMMAHAATDYATGWMPGDIRGAFLCGTATGSLAAGSIVSNDLSAATGLTLAGAGLTHNAGAGTLDWSASTGTADYTLTSLTVGQSYLVQVVVSGYTSGTVALQIPAGTNVDSATSARTLWGQFTATATTQTIRLAGTSSFTGIITSFRADVGTFDRSWKGRGLLVAGAPVRAAVAAGGQAYWSGFGVTSYLEQAYNADMDFGTGDFAVVAWTYCTDTAATRTVVGRGQSASMTGAGRWSLSHLSTSGDFAFTCGDSGGSKTISGGDIRGNSSLWRQCVAVRRAGVMELWSSGVRVATDTSTHNVTNSSAILRIGVQPDGSAPGTGVAAALLRVTATAPDPRQIRAMYEQERRIMEGMPATLGGISAAISSLAANDETGTHLVGTVDGVSIFAGLARIAYWDGASGGAAVANDAIVAVSGAGPHLLIATAANAGVISEAEIARDQTRATAPTAPAMMTVTGVTTDATATLLVPLLYVGERETGVVRVSMLARVYGASATENGIWSLTARFNRDAGGNVAILTEADSQGAVRWDTGTPGAEAWTDKTSGATAVAIVTSGTEYVGVQVTGLGATRIEWEGTMSWERIARDQTYAA